MLSADVQLIDIDGGHWVNWYRLLMPPKLRNGPRVALLLLERSVPTVVVSKVVVRGRGAVPLERVTLASTSRGELERVGRELDVDAVVAVERAVIPAIFQAVERDLSVGHDFVAQLLVCLRVLERYRGKGIWSSPPILELIPPLSYDALRRTFDMLVADRTSMLAYVFEDDGSDVHASIIALERDGHLDLVSTHMGVEDEIAGPDLARDWRKQHQRLTRVVGERYGKVALAVLLERATFERVLVGPPDQLAREINLGNVVLDPAPAWLLGLLGSATMAAVAGRGAKVLASMLPSRARKMATNLAQSAQQVMRESGAHPFALLGFDPIELWHQLRRLYQPAD